MAPITLVALSTISTPPTKANPSNFASRADNFLGELPTLQTELNAAITELNKITSGLDQTTPISAYASGTTYDFPDVCAGTDGHTYRCISTSVIGDDPVGSATGDWFVLNDNTPPGMITAFIGGYFTDGSNGGFTAVITNTVADVNAHVTPYGYRVCDGSALNLSGSTFHDGVERYLPNLTDDIFIMGDLTAGGTGGNNAMAHTHTTGDLTLTIDQMPSHTHSNCKLTQMSSVFSAGHYMQENGTSLNTGYAGGGLAHNHGDTGSASVTENRPKFLSCFYIMKVA
jgi:hypothetical protein